LVRGKWAELNIIQPKKIDAQRGKGAKKSHPFLITKNENETDSSTSKAEYAEAHGGELADE
jgi:hypothetical protein